MGQVYVVGTHYPYPSPFACSLCHRGWKANIYISLLSCSQGSRCLPWDLEDEMQVEANFISASVIDSGRNEFLQWTDFTSHCLVASFMDMKHPWNWQWFLDLWVLTVNSCPLVQSYRVITSKPSSASSLASNRTSSLTFNSFDHFVALNALYSIPLYLRYLKWSVSWTEPRW